MIYPKQDVSNFLITGPPRSGKSTVCRRLIEKFTMAGLKCGGILCPEVREKGKRIGFKIIDIFNKKEDWLAHVSIPYPKVSKYGVNLNALDRIGVKALDDAIHNCDVIFIDEIGPMEVYSQNIKTKMVEVLNSQIPAVCAIHYTSRDNFIRSVKNRRDVVTYTLTSYEDVPKVIESVYEAVIEYVERSDHKLQKG